MKKVSIITPCFNGEAFVGRYLDSILAQTYKNIEMIFINDGSTDRTEEIVKSYIKEFKKQGMSLIYIYQENKGQAAALNKGLAIFSGDYLTWPDSDDILMPDNIEKKVAFLEENQEYGLVRTDAISVNEEDIETITSYFARNRSTRYSEEIFSQLIDETMYVCCGCYMVRVTAFLSVNPQRAIFESRGGQNWQMLLPITYKYKCGYIDEPLYVYVVRKSSHSHSVNTTIEELSRCDEHELILNTVVNAIKMSNQEKKQYLDIIEQKYLRKRLVLASRNCDAEIAKINFRKLNSKFKVSKGEIVLYIMSKNKLLKLVGKVLFKVVGLIKLARS